MKKALIKDTFREIRHSFDRFFSIFIIIVLGCGFFSGIKATMPDMIDTAKVYFEEHNLMDLRLMSSIGVKSDDVEAVKKADGVSGVMAGYSKDVYYHHDNQNLVLKFMSYNDKLDESSPNKLNKPELLEGRYPESDDECLIEVKMSSPDTFVIGGTLKINEPDESKKITDTLSTDTYKIVGIVTSPLYIGYERDATTVGNGTVVSNVYVPEYDFVTDYYTDMYVKFDCTDELDPFSDEYKNKVESVKVDAVSTFEKSVNSRYDTLIEDAQEKINDAQEKADTIENTLSLDENALSAQLNSLNEKVTEAQKTYDSKTEGSSAQLLARSALLQAQQAQEMVSQLMSDYQNNVQTAHNDYTQQLEDARDEIEVNQNLIDEQSSPNFYTFNRFEASNDYNSFYGDSQKVDSIAKVFPVFFILIAALVCLTTMTRMVEEQRIQIGTYKALGYSSAKIASKYIVYSSVAAVSGSCIGTILGLQIFPTIIYSCYKIMYNIPVLDTPFKADYMMWCILASVACTGFAVMYSCMRELRSVPSTLMRPKPPHSGKRVALEKISFIWNKFSFLTKVTVRNLFRYKKRFFMTLVGVTGCTALIVTGFGLKNSIKTIAEKQFNEVFVYDGMVVLNSENYDHSHLNEKLSETEGVDKYMFTQTVDGVAENNDVTQTVSMAVINNSSEMENYIHLRDVKNGGKLSLENGSVIITQKLSKMLDLSVGDTINVSITDEKNVDLKIGGISKNYAMHYIYITPETFEDIYGKSPEYNLAFVNLNPSVDENAFKESLIENYEFYGLSYKSDSSKGFLNSVDSLNSIVVLLIVCAGGLAIIVLYNLANINITERVREIATIKVLGFYDKETSDYICRENYISSVIGIVIGFFVGKILHYFVVITAEVDIVMFNRELVWWAYVFAAVMTLLFTALVNLILHFKLKKIDMVESLKSVE